ncbi:MAG: transketolase [Firmicutes bacterium]|nr:transketolase [Bacillota bacterium]
MKERNYQELREIARRCRIDALKAIYAANSGHPGGSFSVTDILVALYFDEMNIDPANPKMENRDRLVLSKGHAVPALYAVLGERGYYDVEEMMSLRQVGSHFQGHPNMHKCPGVEMSTGSLGQGYSVAVGMAIADKMEGKDSYVYAVTGDGELQEGIIWEAALSAAKYQLDRFITIVDCNGLQIDGQVDVVKKVQPIDAKFEAFGFNTIVCDGHDFESLLGAIDQAKANAGSGKPTAIIANTHKGQGVSFMCDQAGWHGKAPNAEQMAEAMKELGGEM